MPETRPITALEVRPQSGNPYPEPFASRMGNADWRALGFEETERVVYFRKVLG